MTDLKDIFPKHILKRERKIKKICEPLNCLGIPLFYYGRVGADGNLVNVTNAPGTLEYYYDKNLYLEDAHFIHPQLLRSGALLLPNSYNPEYIEKTRKHGNIGNLLLITCSLEHSFEGFIFGFKTLEASNDLKFLRLLNVLKSFTIYFRNEAAPHIERAQRDDFNIKKIKGKAFLERSSSPLANRSPHEQRFLNLISTEHPHE